LNRIKKRGQRLVTLNDLSSRKDRRKYLNIKRLLKEISRRKVIPLQRISKSRRNMKMKIFHRKNLTILKKYLS
jgi:hypothetical protein